MKTTTNSELKVVGREIFKNGVKIGKIYGDRPHVKDIHKGCCPCVFHVIFVDGTRDPLTNISYFKDAVKYVKNSY